MRYHTIIAAFNGPLYPLTEVMMKTTLLVAFLGSTLAIAGCAAQHPLPFEVHQPPGTGPAATLYTTATVNIDVPKIEHQTLSVAVAAINGQPVDSTYPVVLPAGIHMLKLRCKLTARDHSDGSNKLFYGQEQWQLKPNQTYHIEPQMITDAYGNPVCSVKLSASL